MKVKEKPAGQAISKIDFAGANIQEVLTALKSGPEGLAPDVAKRRLARFGKNEIAQAAEMHIVWKFLSYFKNPLVVILLVAALVSGFIGDRVSAGIIVLMAVLSVLLDFFEEYSAGKAAKKLKEAVKNTACVIRAGVRQEVKTASIVPGEVIFLNAGDLVPADSRIISSKDLFVDQSALTGESFPCEKGETGTEAGDTGRRMLYLGTSVISGEATAVVVATGKNTEFGRITASLAKPASKSEFEAGAEKFGIFIARVVLYLVLFIFLFNTLRHLGSGAHFQERVLQSFLFSVAIAVGLTPELLPMIVSVTMARGSIKMSKKGVIVKKLSAIPSFGSMEVLCADKTGTLTENKIALVTYTDINGKVSQDTLRSAYINSFHQTGIENPLDQALMDFKKIAIGRIKKIDELPFDFERRLMSVIVADGKDHFLIAKGSPESVFTRCEFFIIDGERNKFDALALGRAREQYRRLSEDGHRVLAVAAKKIKHPKPVYHKDEEAGLELLGFVSFFDPPKKGIKKILSDLSDIGIEMKIITGDNELVTRKICRDAELKIKGILTGADIDRLTDQALAARTADITIFARCSPIQKNRVIAALRRQGRAVSYLGDGINDAPSLKTADVGISVNNAVDVAKEAADIVLTHKDLAALKDGVIEGRKVFGNTMKYIMMGLSSNFGNMFSAAGAVVFLPFLPMLPIQILLNNFLYDLSQVAIPMDNVDGEWLQKPRRWSLEFIKKFMYFFGSISSLFDFLTFFILFNILAASEGMFQTGWFMESLATQVLVIHVIRTRRLPFIQSRAGKFLLASTLVCVAVGWTIPFTALGRFFKFQPLTWPAVAAIALIVLGYLVIAQVAKGFFYRRYFKLL
jgi:Mg2+-importing ATPase